MTSDEPTKNEWKTAVRKFNALIDSVEKFLAPGYTLIRITASYPAPFTRRAKSWHGPRLSVPAARLTVPIPSGMGLRHHVKVRLSHEGANGFTVVLDCGGYVGDQRHTWFRLPTATATTVANAMQWHHRQLGKRGVPRPHGDEEDEE